ncbi:WD40-repeat-containing domain protein [Absidia repens]|uniref:WD40-repeat-containing domain protein n=1 Tax=Absidia repens TaxID=90262 RepID=A0A1X2IMT3_9FUNG|nr:WD40-repeat-containing domain protein [Absidia repens]
MPSTKSGLSFKHTTLLRYFKKSAWRDRLKSPPLVNRIDEGFYQNNSSKSLTPLLITLYSSSNLSSMDSLERSSTPSNEVQAIDFLTELPVEISQLVLAYCDPDTVVMASYVSRHWYMLCNDTPLWKTIYQERYGLPTNLSLTAFSMNTMAVRNYKRMYQSKTLLEHRWRHGKHQTHCIQGHGDSIYCVQFDKTKIVTGSRDRTIKFWDISSGRCLRTLLGHHASVLCLKYNDDWLVSGSSDHSVLVWSMHTFQVVRRLTGHSSGVLDVSFDQDYIASCSKDATIRLWHAKTGQPLRTLRGHRGPVNAIQFKNHQLVSASGDATIRLYDMKTGRCLRDFVGHSRGLACIQFDGASIVSGSNDNDIKVWNAHTGLCTLTLTGHTGLVRAMDFDQHKIVSASYDESIRVWCRHTGACLLIYPKCHSSWIFDVMFDNTKIVSTSQDQKILIMDFGHGIDTQLLVDPPFPSRLLPPPSS